MCGMPRKAPADLTGGYHTTFRYPGEPLEDSPVYQYRNPAP